MVDIRRAQIADSEGLSELFDQLDALHRVALPEIYREPEGPARPQSYLCDLVQDPDGLVLVASERGEQRERILGFLNAQISQTKDYPILVPRRYARVENLCVRSCARRRGVGRALMEAASQWAADHGAKHIELGVWAFNAEARAFYESLGYETATLRMWRQIE